MKCFILSEPPDARGLIWLRGKDYHYLVRVRRFTVGMVFKALLPQGEEVHVRVCSIEDNCLVGECFIPLQKSEPNVRVSLTSPSLPPIVLFQALPKGAKMDLIVRQAAEGGIAEIVPFVSDHSVPNIKSGHEKIERWTRIIKEARQQSGSGINTRIKAPCTMDGLMVCWKELKSRYAYSVGILLHQDPLERGSFHDYLTNAPECIVLAVGPEGGFSPGEVAQFLAVGFKPVILGATVLRTETAAVCAAAVIRIILVERESWISKIP
jgi:16S rRNA (uracil1498-N3)-methyltransferase